VYQGRTVRFEQYLQRENKNKKKEANGKKLLAYAQ